MNDSPNLDVLLGVPLRVTAELGACTLAVRTILTLGAGAIVELDRAAGAPIDLRVNDKLVARGELIAVDERYGVRITELVDES